MFRIKCVLYLDGDILDADGIDGWRINHLGSEVTELHGLHVREFIDGIGTLDDLRIGCHKTIHIRPDLQYLCIQHGSDDRSRIVRATTAQVGRLMGVTITGDKARYHIYALVAEVLEGFLHQFCGQVGINHVLTLLLLGTDEVTAVHTDTVLDHRSHDM